ncbi:MAG TPA: hypothetical protein DIT13_02365 [Verrucomicrobiales bacterium]|nr:hypothetical protein [Verrucomicrobiales bacterium]
MSFFSLFQGKPIILSEGSLALRFFSLGCKLRFQESNLFALLLIILLKHFRPGIGFSRNLRLGFRLLFGFCNGLSTFKFQKLIPGDTLIRHFG